jgi:hypothetical protein
VNGRLDPFETGGCPGVEAAGAFCAGVSAVCWEKTGLELSKRSALHASSNAREYDLGLQRSIRSMVQRSRQS